ncbi:glycosyltransferase family 4 protein [Oceanomicrobium pacificus]|uniref:Glycosyltransferase n=1 Tax=Oceanomicrobium pacificus TaxID=2692916 RepID=A0A6B0TMZ7_9RHOB|nr:glycosyltransferase family 4 protein [Oceanomicrobium pacificus]MXU65226.1 glycosyltransferase [Oceanomicrobium pacificus]
MRLVFILSGLSAGGAEKIIALLAAHRMERGDEVHVVAMYCPEEGPYFPLPDGVKVHVLDRGAVQGGRGLQWRRLRFIRRTLREIAPDVAVSFLTKINVLSLLATVDRDFPLLVSERNNPKAQKNNRLWKHLNLLMSGTADRIVMLTRRSIDQLPNRLQRRAFVIPNPCMRFPNILYSHSTGKRVIAVGRLDYQKGFDLLIPAFRSVLAAHPDATLKIFGEGRERQNLEALIRKENLEETVSLPGTTKRSGEWIEHGDLFVLPSRHEGFANVVAEAAAAGLPIVAFDCDFGPAEILKDGETGLLVPDGDVDAMVKALIDLLDDPSLRQKMSENAPATVAHLSLENVMQLWDAAIDGLVADRSG